MAETADLIKEFKNAKPPEKAVIILGIVAVGGVAFYLWRKGNAASTTATTAQSQTGQAAGFPTTASGTPVLPAGVNPVFDQNGNLIAFQNQPPPAPPPPPVQTGPVPSPNQLTMQQLIKSESFRPVPPLRMIPSNTAITKTAKKRVM